MRAESEAFTESDEPTDAAFLRIHLERVGYWTVVSVDDNSPPGAGQNGYGQN
jgi:hypothetical protein